MISANGTSLWNEDYENSLSSAYNSSYYTNTIVNANVLNYGSAANYAWSNGDTTYNINGLAPGSYTNAAILMQTALKQKPIK